VVAVYSAFFTRAFDQANLDVGLHRLPVVTVLDRAGITGDDGPSHHGVLALALCLSIPDMTVFAPSNADEVGVLLETPRSLPGPSSIRFPKTPPPARCVGVGEGLRARRLREGDGSVCVLAVGKLVGAALDAADLLMAQNIDAAVYDVRVVSPPDPEMIATALGHRVVVTIEDGFRHGGAGEFLLEALGTAARETGVVAHGKPDGLLAELGLDGAGIAESVRRALEGLPETVVAIPFAPHQMGLPP